MQCYNASLTTIAHAYFSFSFLWIVASRESADVMHSISKAQLVPTPTTKEPYLLTPLHNEKDLDRRDNER